MAKETAKNKEVGKISDTVLALIEKLATNPDVDADKLQAVINMGEATRIQCNKELFNEAMALTQSRMPIVPNDRKNAQTNSKYTSYEQLLKWTKHIYTEAGFSLSFYEGEASKKGEIRIYADVMHVGGETRQWYVDIPLDNAGIKGTVNKTGPHAKGSSISYGRSYLMRMIFNVSTGENDDGNGASGKVGELTLKSIETERKRLGIPPDNFKKRLAAKFGVGKPELLFEHQGAELLRALRNM